MQTTSYQALKITPEIKSKFDDILVVEAPLQININNEPYTVVMRTPSDDVELIRGLLFAEDIYKKNNLFKYSIIDKKTDGSSIINITINDNDLGKGYLNKRTLLSLSSCGICGKKELNDIKQKGDKINDDFKIQTDDVLEMMQKMSAAQEHFKKSGGSHAAALFNTNKTLLSIKEDIGRHNAVDKVIGDLLQKNTLKQCKFLVVSGRVSYEIISKAFIAKIPFVVAVSACSSLAVDFAKEFGICLIGFTRNSNMTIYANPQKFNT